MKAVVLNGFHAGDPLRELLQENVETVLRDAGWDIKLFMLSEMTIRPCQGDFQCWIKTPGKCMYRDTHAVMQAMIQSQMVFMLTPVTFGGYSSELKKMVDHFIPYILPFFTSIDGETHHAQRYAQHFHLRAIGVMDKPDAHEKNIFQRLVARNAINVAAQSIATEVLLRKDVRERAAHGVQALLPEKVM